LAGIPSNLFLGYKNIYQKCIFFLFSHDKLNENRNERGKRAFMIKNKSIFYIAIVLLMATTYETLPYPINPFGGPPFYISPLNISIGSSLE
jgi:hypothetical protein